MGLPTPDDLTPLSQLLIPPELASAFSICPEPHRTPLDVNRASQTTLSNIRGQLNVLSSNNFKSFNETTGQTHDPIVVDLDNKTGAVERDGPGSEARKLRRVDSEEADSRTENSAEDPSSEAARALKRPRLVWTPQLHKRFVDVGLSSDGPSASDQLFASTPLPQSLPESSGGGGGNGSFGMPIPMPYHHTATAGGMMPMPVYGHMGMQMGNNNGHNISSSGNHQHHQVSINGHQNGYNGNIAYGHMFQQRDWNGNHYGSYTHHPHQVAPNDNM
ncbi:hypothetical protein OIU84_008626 [Salix udensis]|uniref:Uncharacterized protein n=1 Tax=Salix udensis TaxID=889485 RepID=A0AAD6JQA7_9ROSI|nr:hypothetical protein OIU84_008626 [Salix udensis]